MASAERLRWLSLVLVGIGLLRLFTFAAHQPLWAYANQYDMARTSACLGLWPVVNGESVDTAHVSAPIPHYRADGPRSAACFPSTTVAVTAAALWLSRQAGNQNEFDLRWLAVWKALLASAVAVFVHLGLRSNPGWQLGFALGFALVICDPFNLLFLGGLYTEFSALLGAWLALGSLTILALRVANATAVGWVPSLGLAIGVVALGASRMQHLLHPFALLLLAGWFWYRSAGRAYGESRGCKKHWLPLLPAFVAAVLVLVLQLGNQQRQPVIADANRLNSLFATILPTSNEPEAMIERIGLPAHCVALNHVSWYLRRGHDPMRECPEAFSYSRVRAMLAMAAEPATVLRLFGQGLLQSSAWRLPYLGEVAGERFAAAPRASISGILAGLGFVELSMLWLLPLLVCSVLLWRLVRGRSNVFELFGLILGAWIVLTWLASLFGDGYSELTRHLHLAQNALLVLWLWLPVWLVVSVQNLRKPASPERNRQLTLAGVGLVGLIVASLAWARLPMATGQLHVSEGGEAVSRLLTVEGWLLSASPVTAVRARIAESSWKPLMLMPADDRLRKIFPVGNGKLVRRFQGGVSLPMDQSGPLDLRVEVAEGGGDWRELDALRLRSGPSAEVIDGSSAPVDDSR